MFGPKLQNKKFRTKKYRDTKLRFMSLYCFNTNTSLLAAFSFAADVELVFGAVDELFDVFAVGKNHEHSAEKTQNTLKPRVPKSPDADWKEQHARYSAQRNVFCEYDDHKEYRPADKTYTPINHPSEGTYA